MLKSLKNHFSQISWLSTRKSDILKEILIIHQEFWQFDLSSDSYQKLWQFCSNSDDLGEILTTQQKCWHSTEILTEILTLERSFGPISIAFSSIRDGLAKNSKQKFISGDCTTKTAILTGHHQLVTLSTRCSTRVVADTVFWVASRRQALVKFASTLRSRSTRGVWSGPSPTASGAADIRVARWRSRAAHPVHLSTKPSTYTTPTPSQTMTMDGATQEVIWEGTELSNGYKRLKDTVISCRGC